MSSSGGVTAAEWNARYPVGTAVRYFPRIGGADFVEALTRSEAWELGDGTGIVRITDRAGGVSLKALEPLPDGFPQQTDTTLPLFTGTDAEAR